jgi:hypothetical protein
VTQQEQFGVLGGRASCQQREPPRRLADHQVQQP